MSSASGCCSATWSCWSCACLAEAPDCRYRLSLTLVAIGFALAAVSGVIMFATQPGDLLSNRTFTLKMLLLFVAGSNAAWFHARQSLAKLDGFARLQMVVSTVIWVIIITLGRWIAY